MLSAIGGNVVSYYFSDIATVSVGASGAIFGLMTATIVIGRELRADVSQLMTLLVLNVVIGFASAGIDWRAHLGGAIVGAATGYLQTHSGKNLRFSGMTAIVVILLALVFVRNQQVLNALMGQ
jgi:membrane associated rhomboid family serine protease